MINYRHVKYITLRSGTASRFDRERTRGNEKSWNIKANNALRIQPTGAITSRWNQSKTEANELLEFSYDKKKTKQTKVCRKCNKENLPCCISMIGKLKYKGQGSVHRIRLFPSPSCPNSFDNSFLLP